eukprot:960453-Rhodomonas_salina.1
MGGIVSWNTMTENSTRTPNPNNNPRLAETSSGSKGSSTVRFAATLPDPTPIQTCAAQHPVQ